MKPALIFKGTPDPKFALVKHKLKRMLSTDVHASWGTDVKSSGRRCVHYQNGWADPKDSTCVNRQQHGIGTQNPGDVTTCPPLETVILFCITHFVLINTDAHFAHNCGKIAYKVKKWLTVSTLFSGALQKKLFWV